MSEQEGPLELIWDALLSRQPDTVREMYASLDPDSRLRILDHLLRMANEAGWHPEQRQSALVALAALKEFHA